MGARIVRKRGRPDLAFHQEQLAKAIERIGRQVPPFESSGAKKAPRERG